MNQEPTRSQTTVWVIDDDETALLLADDALSHAGFQVQTYTDAPSALAAAQTKLPDIIVLDVIMPGMNGFEFCTALRCLPRGAVVPILVTTSLDDTAAIDQAYAAGATNFAIKPLNWAIEIYRLDYMLRSAKIALDLLEKEHETRLAKEDWERTFDSISDVVTVLGADLKILRANQVAQTVFNRAPKAIVGRLCHELFNPGGGACPDCPVPRVLATGQPAAAEIKSGPAGGLFEITVSPVASSQGQITHFVHVARDLSEKKELEAELRQAQKMEAIGTLAGGIAHDFNNLMMVVQGCAELLLAEAAAAGRNREDLDAILEAAKRGARLTKQLLIFGRKQSNFSQRRPLDLNSLLRKTLQMVEKGLSKSISHQFRLGTGLHLINADSIQLEQVVMNLAVNAAHAMPVGGTLTYQTQNVHVEAAASHSPPGLDSGDYVLLTVSDTGCGMDEATLAHIYEPFFTTRNVGDGSGLGLAVVFGIVREHKGHISCYSEVGVGTTFRIYLPAIRQPAGESQPTAAKPPAMARGSETILIADDEASIRGLLERFLTRQGYTVITAADGEVALRRYSEATPRPQAVILDLGMPNMSGWECVAQLRQLDPHVKVLLASGYGLADLESRAVQAGASGFVGKPYNLAQISSKLREILDAPQ